MEHSRSNLWNIQGQIYGTFNSSASAFSNDFCNEWQQVGVFSSSVSLVIFCANKSTSKLLRVFTLVINQRSHTNLHLILVTVPLHNFLTVDCHFHSQVGLATGRHPAATKCLSRLGGLKVQGRTCRVHMNSTESELRASSTAYEEWARLEKEIARHGDVQDPLWPRRRGGI